MTEEITVSVRLTTNELKILVSTMSMRIYRLKSLGDYPERKLDNDIMVKLCSGLYTPNNKKGD